MTKSIDVVPTWYWPDGVPRYLSPPRSTVYKAAVERWARRTPESIALVGDGVSVDFASLAERARSASTRIRRLAAERAAGERLRLAMTDATGIDGVVALLAATLAGADTLLIHPATPHADLAGILSGFGCDLLIGGDGGDGQRRPWLSVELSSISQVPAAGDGATADEAVDRSADATVGLRWGDSIMLQPNEALLGWAMAFRAFASLEKGDRFAVTHPLSSWEGMTGLLAPLVVGGTSVLPGASPQNAVEAAASGSVQGVWLDRAEAEALVESGFSRPGRRDPRQWVYVSVSSAMPVRARKRLKRLLDIPVLTAFGTPATGLVAASPQAWFIEEAVGIPVTGVDVVPVDGAGGHLAEPPWPLLAFANLGVKSTFLAPAGSLHGTAPGRFIEPDVLDVGVECRIDSNGFVYLI
ncbi:MAG: hypothetical protein OEM97_07170 [Acidimicrobiia bacterium]|nr:hypothetical protein [Acidimicrobiia bacterium]